MPPRIMNPPLNSTFNDVYDKIINLPNQSVYGLRTTGGVVFKAKASIARDGRLFIKLPHNNRIYERDWSFTTNHMGNDGQRIGHYARPLDEWCNE